MDIVAFRRQPVFGILRGIAPDILEPLIETIVSSGLKTVEITMNTPGAADLILRATALAKGRLTIGAGTVLETESLKAALDAGATFIVTPVLNVDVMTHCARNKIPAFPGALTPTEIHHAWRAGAAMVKVFPSNVFGPGYFKAIKGPFRDVELLACGGVTPENLKTYLDSGASAASFGASVFKKEWLAQKDFASIGQAIRTFLNALAQK